MLLRRYHKREAPATPVVNDAEKPADFEHMTVAELREYAAAHNIDLGERKLKADILAVLKND